MFDEFDWITFPAVLTRVVPLQIGIRRDFEALLPHRQYLALYETLAAYTNSWEYLVACAADGSLRHGINGVPVGEVSAEDRSRAATLLLAMAVRDLAISAKMGA